MVTRKQYDLDSFRKLVKNGKTKNEIIEEMSIKTGATFNSLFIRLMETDKTYYEIKGSDNLNKQKPFKATIGKNTNLTLSSKMLESSGFNAGDSFTVKIDKKKITLTLIEKPETTVDTASAV